LLISCLVGLGVKIHRKHGAADLVRELAQWDFPFHLIESNVLTKSVKQDKAAWQSSEYHKALSTHFVAEKGRPQHMNSRLL
jgi:hypothetical protein